MKLDIINFNPNINEDKEILKNFMFMCGNIEQNITTKKYLPYQNILNKINRFINMISSSFEKDMKYAEEESNYFDETNSDDDISVSSISVYEYDPDDDEIEIRNIEDELIKNFDRNTKVKFAENIQRFDFEYEN
jgi:hypothetical protein